MINHETDRLIDLAVIGSTFIIGMVLGFVATLVIFLLSLVGLVGDVPYDWLVRVAFWGGIVGVAVVFVKRLALGKWPDRWVR